MSEILARLAKVQQEGSETRKTQRDELVQLVLSEKIELFRSQDDEAFATFASSSKVETYQVKGSAFRLRLSKLFFDRTGRALGGQASREALETLESQALVGGRVHPVAVRVAEAGGSIFIDLGDDGWRAIEVSESGWRANARPPIRFRRPAKCLSLPFPVQGGSLDDLRSFVNCPDDQSFTLLLAWCLTAFRSGFATPILVLHGEQGSAKSTTAKVIQSLIDPGLPALRSAPKTEQDLVVAARNRQVLTFDNLSGIPDSLSDALCRLCTGGGYGARQLFTDSDEIVFEGTRAIILTGIDDLLRRHDLTDRALLLTLPPISEELRQGDDLLARFEAAKPRIFGALLDALSSGLRRFPSVKLARLPRMADFAKFATACEIALGLEEGGFMSCYRRNRSDAAEQSLEADSVATAVRELMTSRGEWEGKPTDLLTALRGFVSDEVKAGHSWPKAPNSLSTRLRRAAPVLRAAEIAVEFCKVGQGAARRRGIRLTKQPAAVVPIVLRPLASEGNPEESSADPPGTMATPGDAPWDDPGGSSGRLAGQRDGRLGRSGRSPTDRGSAGP